MAAGSTATLSSACRLVGAAGRSGPGLGTLTCEQTEVIGNDGEANVTLTICEIALGYKESIVKMKLREAPMWAEDEPWTDEASMI